MIIKLRLFRSQRNIEDLQSVACTDSLVRLETRSSKDSKQDASGVCSSRSQDYSMGKFAFYSYESCLAQILEHPASLLVDGDLTCGGVWCEVSARTIEGQSQEGG